MAKFQLGKNIKFEFLGKKGMAAKSFNEDFVTKSENEIRMSYGNKRPSMDYMRATGGDIVRIPYYPLNRRTLFDLAIYSDILRVVIQSKRKETFRQGYEIEEVFSKKCNECEKEFDYDEDECDECGSTDLRGPEIEQRKRLELFLPNVNDNHQNLMMVSGEINDDIETIDDGFMLMTKDYYFEKDKKDEGKSNFISSVPVELLRVHPLNIYIIADKTGRPGRDQEGKPVLTCVNHRDQYVQDNEYCSQCGCQLLQAHYRAEDYDGQFIYYVKGEVYHRSLYSPSVTYGFSPILSVWLKVTTLMSMDYYMNKYYTKQRPPVGMFLVNTPNMESLEKAWNWMLDQFKENPHQIPPLAIENPKGHGGKIGEFINFMNTLQEMQYTESRNEFRRTIGAVFGVMPLFQADLSAGGGLNNEGLQITVTNRAIEDTQKIYNEGFYPWITDQMSITDYKIVLKPSEEEDEIHELDLESAKIRNAAMMQSMGYCYDDKTEILTDKGWKSFKDITNDEVVATLNPETEKLEYQKIKNRIAQTYKGIMHKYDSQHISLVVTPNHKIYAQKYQYGRDCDFKLYDSEYTFGKRIKLKKDFKWSGYNQEYFRLPDIVKNSNSQKSIDKIKMDDWLEFLGWFLSEGSCFINESHYIVDISQREYSTHYGEIKECLDRIGFKYQQTPVGYRIIMKQLYDYLKQFGKSNQKYIPREILNLESNQLIILLESLIKGDGWEEEKCRRYCTVSNQLADDVQELALKVGYVADISIKKQVGYQAPNGTGNYDLNIVRLTTNRKEVLIDPYQDNREYYFIEKYDGMIYCVEVPKYNLVYVRRNGKTCWSGNSVTLNEQKEFEFEPTEEPVKAPDIGGAFGGATGAAGGSPSPFTGDKPSGQSKPSQRFSGQPGSVERSIKKGDGLRRISTGRVELRRGEPLVILTEHIKGEIEKIKIDIDESQSSEINIVITTQDEEEILNITRDKSSIFYPKNTSVINQEMVGSNIQKAKKSLLDERYICDGNLKISLKGSGTKDVIDDIEITVRQLEVTKSEGTAASSTAGVFNPVSSRRRNITRLITNSIKKVGKEMGKGMPITKAEENIEEMMDFIEDSLYSKKFSGVGKSASDRIKDFIIRSIVEGKDLSKVMKYIERTGGKNINAGQAQLIARTEMQALQNKAREWAFKSFDPNDKEKYKWLGPNDSRVTNTCKAIKKRTSNGVSMDQLKSIVKDESRKAILRGELPSNFKSRDFTPHFSCRHTFIRHI